MAISIKKCGLAAALAFFGSFLFAQTDDEFRPPKFGGFENEVALFPLAFYGLVSGEKFGEDGSLIFKHQVLPTTERRWRRKMSVRVCGGFQKDKSSYQFSLTSIEMGDFSNDTINSIHSIGSFERSRSAQIGLEWNWQKRRFEHWIGVDLGIRWGKNDGFRAIETSLNGRPLLKSETTSETVFSAPGICPFWGSRFFLIKRLSLGIEIGFPAELVFRKSFLTTTGVPSSSASQSQIWHLGSSRPRFLFAAFHF